MDAKQEAEWHFKQAAGYAHVVRGAPADAARVLCGDAHMALREMLCGLLLEATPEVDIGPMRRRSPSVLLRTLYEVCPDLDRDDVLEDWVEILGGWSEEQMNNPKSFHFSPSRADGQAGRIALESAFERLQSYRKSGSNSGTGSTIAGSVPRT